MNELAEQLGFRFSHKGCPCNGTPKVYKCEHDGGLYTLTIWERRDMWRLEVCGCSLGTGNKSNLLTKLPKLWA